MSALLDEQYLTWLYGQIGSVKLRNSSRTHWSLCRQLYKKEFLWLIPNDDNRVMDGIGLREEFLDVCNVKEPDGDWLDLPCSMLELLISLSRRLSFEADGEPRVWFWHLIETLDLEQFNDKDYDDLAEAYINDKLDSIIWRTYHPTGRGGLFPLRRAQEDQTHVELWYQMNAYLLEHDN